MTETIDGLVKRLRDPSRFAEFYIRNEAADRITALQEEVERLKDANRLAWETFDRVCRHRDTALSRVRELEAGLREIRDELEAYERIRGHSTGNTMRALRAARSSLSREGEEEQGNKENAQASSSIAFVAEEGRDPSGQATREPSPDGLGPTGECPSRGGGAS